MRTFIFCAVVALTACHDSTDPAKDGDSGEQDPAGPDGILGTADDPAGPDGVLGTADDPAGPDGILGNEDDPVPDERPDPAPSGDASCVIETAGDAEAVLYSLGGSGGPRHPSAAEGAIAFAIDAENGISGDRGRALVFLRTEGGGQAPYVLDEMSLRDPPEGRIRDVTVRSADGVTWVSWVRSGHVYAMAIREEASPDHLEATTIHVEERPSDVLSTDLAVAPDGRRALISVATRRGTFVHAALLEDDDTVTPVALADEESSPSADVVRPDTAVAITRDGSGCALFLRKRDDGDRWLLSVLRVGVDGTIGDLLEERLLLPDRRNVLLDFRLVAYEGECLVVRSYDCTHEDDPTCDQPNGISWRRTGVDGFRHVGQGFGPDVRVIGDELVAVASIAAFEGENATVSSGGIQVYRIDLTGNGEDDAYFRIPVFAEGCQPQFYAEPAIQPYWNGGFGVVTVGYDERPQEHALTSGSLVRFQVP